MTWLRTIAIGAAWILIFVAGIAGAVPGNNDFIRRQVIRESAQKPARHRGDRQTLAGRRSGFGSGARALDLVHGDQEPSRPGPSVRRRPHEAAGPRALGVRHSHGKPLSRTYRPDERMTTIPMDSIWYGGVVGLIARDKPKRHAGRAGTSAHEVPLMDTIKRPWQQGKGSEGETSDCRGGTGPYQKILTAKPGRGRTSTGIVNKPGPERARKVATTSKRGRLEFLPAGGRLRCDGVTLHTLTGNRGTQPGSRHDRILGRGNRGMAGAGEPARTII